MGRQCTLHHTVPSTIQCILFDSPQIYSLKLPRFPQLSLRANLDSCITPVNAMVVTLVVAATNARAFQRLIICEGREDTKDDRNTRIQLRLHESMRD